MKKIKHNDLMSKNYKKTLMNLNYLDQFLLFICDISGCALIPEFASLVGILTRIAIFRVGINICLITAGSENYK